MSFYTIHPFRSRGIYADIPAFVNEIQQGVERYVAPVIEGTLTGVARNTKMKVKFSTTIDTFPDGVFSTTSVGGQDAKIWGWVSGGTKEHPIRVKKTKTLYNYKGYRPALRLNRYQPRTSAHFPLAAGGAGKRLMPTAYRFAVIHPGIRARNFEYHATEQLRKDPDFQRIMENTLRRACRRAQAAGG